MGYTPQQVGEMSLWQFVAAVEGYAKANSSDEGLSAKEADDLWEMVKDG
jgi:hypothetical protein